MLGLSLVSVVAVAALASASIRDNSIDSGERVIYVAPVLAPPRDSRTHVTDRARQFPILILLAQPNPLSYQNDEAKSIEGKSLEVSQQPIYVKKLEDQERDDGREQARSALSRQRRSASPSPHKGGYGGYGQQPITVAVILPNKHKRGRGGHHHHRGGDRYDYPQYNNQPVYQQGPPGYSQANAGAYAGSQSQGGYQQPYPQYQQPCGGGCGGNGGGSQSSSFAYATAGSSSYGKR